MITLLDLKELSTRAKAVVANAREKMLAPESVKRAPLFSVTDVEEAVGLSASRVRTLLRTSSDAQGKLPQGRTKQEIEATEEAGETLDGRGQKKFFTVEEYHRILRCLIPSRFKPAGMPGVIAPVVNFKGGVAKSTSAACIAQALSCLGHKVCVLDLDPQGSLTNLFGYLQILDVRGEQTAYSVLAGDSQTLKPCIRKTYWPGIDIVPSAPQLQVVESNFKRDLEKHGTDVLARLSRPLKELQQEYDFIIIDTPPSLNNLTLHALLNADGVLMPLPPSNLDLASASQFWDLFLESCQMLGITDDNAPVFRFLRIFSTKTEEKTRSCRNVLSWIKDSYGSYCSAVRVPKSAAVTNASDAFGTVFDVPVDTSIKKGSSQQIVRSMYLELANEIYIEANEIWRPTTQAASN